MNNTLPWHPLNDTGPIRVVIYVRVSSRNLDIGHSSEAQIALCKAYIEKMGKKNRRPMQNLLPPSYPLPDPLRQLPQQAQRK